MLEMIGYAAGLLVLISAIPNILSAYGVMNADKGLPARNALQMVGNLLWVVYGLYLGATPIMVFCGLSVLTMALLLAKPMAVKTP